MKEDCILKINNLTKVYNKKKVINNLSIKVKKNSIYGLVGKNGAGKTTIIRLIAGLAKPTSGEVEFSDDFQEGSDWRKKLSAVIETPSFYSYLNAKQNLEAQRLILGVKDKNKANELLELVGLSDAGSKKAGKFSLGMKQRLGIAIGLIGDPEFVILDEPINGLDPVGIREIRNMLLDLNQRGVTIMISSHVLSELVKVATDYGVINKGEIVDEFDANGLEDRLKSSINVKVNDVKKAVEIIIDKFGSIDYKIVDGWVRVYTNEINVSQISSLLSDNDIIIEDISKEGGDYEDYFIKMMEKTNEKKSSLDINEHNDDENKQD